MAAKKRNRSVKAAATASLRYSTASLIGRDDPDVLCMRVTGRVTRDVATAITSDVGGLLKSQQEKGGVWMRDAAAMALDPDAMAQATAQAYPQTREALGVVGCVVHADVEEWFSVCRKRSARNGIGTKAFQGLSEATIWAVVEADHLVDLMADVRYEPAESARLAAELHHGAHLAAERVAKFGIWVSSVPLNCRGPERAQTSIACFQSWSAKDCNEHYAEHHRPGD